MLRMKEDVLFETNDLIAVFGGEVGKEGQHADRVSICRVLICGEKDLIVEDLKGSSFSRPSHHLVSKSICCKLFMDPSKLSDCTPINPQIGDLVLSYTRDAFREEPPVEITGILYKIAYKLGKPNKCTLIFGNEFKEVLYNSLIVLQKN